MIIKEPTTGRGLVTLTNDMTTQTITLTQHDQREVLEALARIHGFTLVGHQERQELLALARNIEDEENDFATGSAAWVAW